MRLTVNITQEGDPHVIEEDIEIALGKVLRGTGAWVDDIDITEQDASCFTADHTKKLGKVGGGHLAEELKHQLEEDTGAEVTVEYFNWNRGF